MLLKTPAELKTYVSVDAKQIPPSIALEIATAETRCIAPLLGPGLLRWLQAAYDAPDFDLATSPAANLLRLVQAPLAKLGTGAGLTGHQVIIDATGVHIIVGETSKTAFAWQVSQLQLSLLREAQRDLDALLQWLEDNHTTSAELTAWATSGAGQRHRRELFTCTADFQQYEFINDSRLVFLALGPVRRRLESFELAPVLGPAFLAELREQVLLRTLSSENENLLRTYVYPALAALTIGHGGAALHLDLASDAVERSLGHLADEATPSASGPAEGVARGPQALATGARYLRQLTDYLDRTASATRFATYFRSATYTDPHRPAVARDPFARTYKLC